jgi:hypothetical protein
VSGPLAVLLNSSHWELCRGAWSVGLQPARATRRSIWLYTHIKGKCLFHILATVKSSTMNIRVQPSYTFWYPLDQIHKQNCDLGHLAVQCSVFKESSSSLRKWLYENLFSLTVYQGTILLYTSPLKHKLSSCSFFGGVSNERVLGPRASFFQRKPSTTWYTVLSTWYGYFERGFSQTIWQGWSQSQSFWS